MPAFLLKLLPAWVGVLSTVVVGAVLGTLLVIQKGETRHWRKQSDRFEKLYTDEHAAHLGTVANYRAAAEKARQADAANAARAKAEQDAINQQRDASYEARIADARARADRLQRDAAARAHPGGAGAAPVPGLPATAGGAPQAPGQDRLPAGDALIATEQAIQLDELIQWVKQQSQVQLSSPPSSLTGSR